MRQMRKGVRLVKTLLMLESDLERAAMQYAEKRGWFEFKIEKASKGGLPDRFLSRFDRGVILVEFKRDGEEPSAQQLKRHKELRDHGVTVKVFDNLTAFKVYFR